MKCIACSFEKACNFVLPHSIEILAAIPGVPAVLAIALSVPVRQFMLLAATAEYRFISKRQLVFLRFPM